MRPIQSFLLAFAGAILFVNYDVSAQTTAKPATVIQMGSLVAFRHFIALVLQTRTLLDFILFSPYAESYLPKNPIRFGGIHEADSIFFTRLCWCDTVC